MIDRVACIALGILLGMMLTALANFGVPDAGGTVIRSVVKDGVNYTVCVPPWDTKDAYGNIHPYGEVP